MKKYTVEFEDVVKYRLEIMAESEDDVIRKVAQMETEDLAEFEVDRNALTPTTVVNEEEI